MLVNTLRQKELKVTTFLKMKTGDISTEVVKI